MADSDDYFNSSDEEMGSEPDSDDGNDDYPMQSDSDMDYPDVPVTPRVPYKVLGREQIQEARLKVIEDVTSITGVTEDEAAKTLRAYKWNAKKLIEDWYDKYEHIRTSVGLVDEKPEPSEPSGRCMICFDTFPYSAMRASACKHYYCKDCWKGYVTEAVANGPACLDLRCPAPDCKPKASVPVALMEEVLAPEKRAQLAAFQQRTFVEDNASMSWCMGQNCSNAVEVVDRVPDAAVDVRCSCGCTFCFNCKEEAHRPVVCELVKAWITKNSAESENMNWILVNCKPCPKCKRQIEKNQGCMHMTCSQCKHEFCWLCIGDWKEHGERTGGFYNCNRFETAKRKGELDGDQLRRENAKASLERYTHYYERYDAHHKAQAKAKIDAGKVSNEWLDHLADSTKTPTSQLKFINEAWAQIVECRRILKYTYAFGYYSWEDPDNKDEQTQRNFFEYQQGLAEQSLERLHEQAEKHLLRHVELARANPAAFDIDAFIDFRKNLIGLTDVTRNFFKKLVEQIERGFEKMGEQYAGHVDEPEPAASSRDGAGSSGTRMDASGAGPSTSKGVRAAPKTRRAKKPRGGAGGDEDEEEDAALLAAQGFWTCSTCTYNNTDVTADSCSMCDQPRGKAT